MQVVYPTDRQLKRYTPDLLADCGYEPGFRVIPKRWSLVKKSDEITAKPLRVFAWCLA